MVYIQIHNSDHWRIDKYKLAEKYFQGIILTTVKTFTINSDSTFILIHQVAIVEIPFIWL